MPSIARIRRLNAVAWGRWNAQFRAIVDAHPEYLREANQRLAEQMRLSVAASGSARGATTLESIVFEIDARERGRQRALAKRPRPNRKTSHGEVVVAAMRRWRRRDPDRDLRGFIDAAEAGSIEGVEIEPKRGAGVIVQADACSTASRTPRFSNDQYLVSCDPPPGTQLPVLEAETFTFRTLERWWLAASKGAKADI